jgi:hypothetical protein
MIDAPYLHADAEASYELAFKEASRALTAQERAVDSFYARAGVTFSGGAIVTSFLGGTALNGGVGIAGWIAVGLFVLFGARVATLLWPKTWQFTAASTRILSGYIEADEPHTLASIHRNLAIFMQRGFDANREQLQEQSKALQFAGVLLLFETLGWVIELAVN